MNKVIPDSGYTAFHASVVRAFDGRCRLVRENGEVTLSFRSCLLPGGGPTEGFIQAAKTADIKVANDNGTLHMRSGDIKRIAGVVMGVTVPATESPAPVLGNKAPVSV